MSVLGHRKNPDYLLTYHAIILWFRVR